MEHKDTEQKYDLYTEKIVLSPKVKYKNLIRTIKILILIIIAGVVYIAADKLIVPSVKAKFDKKKAEQDRIEFTRDEYPEPVAVEDEEGQPQIKKDYDTLMQSLRTKVDDVQKSVVIIQESTEGLNYENYIENRENVTSTAGLIVAFGAVKVAQITGLDHLAAYLIGRLATKLISAENTAALTDGVETVLGNALKGATGAASDFAAALGPLVGTAGLIIAVGGAATVATSELAGFVETMQGGNGIGSTFGNTMNNFIQTLQHRGDIISGSAEEIWQLKESLEQEGMTAEDKASATQKLIDKLGEMGVTSDQAEQAFSSLYQQGLITDDMFDILSESIKTLGDNTTNMAGSIDLGKQCSPAITGATRTQRRRNGST